MDTLLEYYDIYPKVLLAGAEAEITIRPLGAHAAFDAAEGYAVCVLPMKETLEPDEGAKPHIDSKYPWAEPVLENGRLIFTHRFGREQEYYVRVYKKNEIVREKCLQFRVYAVDADLYERRPYRGDLHVHSNWSDGREEPAIVMASYRKAGFDFVGLTDHRRHEASVAAIDAYKDAAVDLCMCTGEEVHIKGNHVHIVNFGGKWSVQKLADSDMDKFNAEVAEIAKNAEIPECVDRFEYAACMWIFKKIQEAGGLAIFPHPHWRSNVYHDPELMTDALFASGAFDAFELLGGVGVNDINTQAALYNEARAKGLDIAVVGSSDSHGQINRDYFNWYTTIAFAKELTMDGIREAVTGRYSAAVETYKGETPHVYGPYRLVSFTLFLLSEYFPIHDEMCFEEGRQMKEYTIAQNSFAENSFMKDETAGSAKCVFEDELKAPVLLKKMAGRTKRYLDRVYGGKG